MGNRAVPTNGWIGSFVLMVGVALVALLVGCQGPSTSRLRMVDLAGRPVDPFQAPDAKATVFLFVGTQCPISNRYAPVVQRLHEKFSPQNVVFWLVYPDPNEPVEAIRKHVEEYGYGFSALRDPQHTLVKLTQVQVTPEAAVFVVGGRMVYQGRIDDWYVSFGKARAAPTTHDLEAALTATLEGKPVPTETTRAVGCYISDLR